MVFPTYLIDKSICLNAVSLKLPTMTCQRLPLLKTITFENVVIRAQLKKEFQRKVMLLS